MQRVFYSSGSVLMGDDAAEALLEYATILARTNQADTVSLRTRHEDGTASETRFLVGPSSELVADGVDSVDDEPDNADAVQVIRERTRALAPARPIAMDPLDDEPFDFDDPVRRA